ncbi:MAG TPA: DUF5335 family protein [Pyrinomonadaceae bacterium]
MNLNPNRKKWSSYIAEFNKRNRLRPTWLQIMNSNRRYSESRDLPLLGVSLEERGVDAPRLQISLGEDHIGNRHLTHSIDGLRSLTVQFGSDGREDSVEFIDKSGVASLLIFRHRAKMAAHA